MPREAPDRMAGAARTDGKASEDRAGSIATAAQSGPGSRAAQCEAGVRERSWSLKLDLAQCKKLAGAPEILVGTTQSYTCNSIPGSQYMERRPAQITSQEVGKGWKRSPRSIRFSDREWDRIETVAARRGITAGELVRAGAIAAAAEGPTFARSDAQLVAQVEQIFRYIHILATEMRNRMLAEGRDEELEELIRSARELQEEMRKRSVG